MKRLLVGKCIHYREIGDKFGVSASTACEKVNTLGTDENLFRLVPVSVHGAQICPMVTNKGLCSDWYPFLSTGHRHQV